MRSTGRALPLWAVGFCVVGLLGLHLPFVEGIAGFEVSIGRIPGVGATLTVVFFALSALPVADLMGGRVRWTPFLMVPAAVGLVLTFVIASAATWLSDASDALSPILTVVDPAVDIGIGAVLLAFAELGIATVSVATLVVWWRSRRAVPVSEQPLPERPLPAPPDEDL